MDNQKGPYCIAHGTTQYLVIIYKGKESDKYIYISLTLQSLGKVEGQKLKIPKDRVQRASGLLNT